MPPGDVGDIDDVQGGVDPADHAAVQEVDHHPPGRCRRRVARPDRRGRQDGDERKAARGLAQRLVLGDVLRLLVASDQLLGVRVARLVARLTGAVAERCHAARVDDALATGGARRREDGARSRDVHLVEALCVVRPEAVERGEVKHKTSPGARRVERPPVANVGDDALEIEADQVRLRGARLEQPNDPGATRGQCPSHRRADEAARAGDEHPVAAADAERMVIHDRGSLRSSLHRRLITARRRGSGANPSSCARACASRRLLTRLPWRASGTVVGVRRRLGRSLALLVIACFAGVGGAPSAVALVGGSPATISSAPWTVLVSYTTSSGSYGCTGSIVAPSLVLTSAFCLYDSSGTVEPLAGLSVIAGVSNYVSPAAGDVQQTRAVDYVRVHPGFAYSGGAVQPDDVALLTLTTPFDLSGGDVQAVALPAVGASFPAGASATITSFGSSSAGAAASGALNAINAMVDPQGQCGQPAGDQLEDANAVEFCATSPSGAICDGDGGAGLVTTSGTPTLVGVANGSSTNCAAGSQGVFAYTGAGEIRDFVQGNNNPPTAPETTKTDPTVLNWYGSLIPGNTLICSTAGWGGAVQAVYSFVDLTTGQVLQSGSHTSFVIPASAVGAELECVSAVTNGGGTTLARTTASPALKAAGPVPHGCDITQPKTLRATRATRIDFVNDIAQPVKLYWLNYHGKRVFYATIAPGRSIVQPTYDSDPWVLLDVSGGCVGYVVAPRARYVVG